MKTKDIKLFLKDFHKKDVLSDDNYNFEDVLDFLINSQLGDVPIILYNEDFYLNSLIVPKKIL